MFIWSWFHRFIEVTDVCGTLHICKCKNRNFVGNCKCTQSTATMMITHSLKNTNYMFATTTTTHAMPCHAKNDIDKVANKEKNSLCDAVGCRTQLCLIYCSIINHLKWTVSILWTANQHTPHTIERERVRLRRKMKKKKTKNCRCTICVKVLLDIWDWQSTAADKSIVHEVLSFSFC